jgi:hypothetical protein
MDLEQSQGKLRKSLMSIDLEQSQGKLREFRKFIDLNRARENGENLGYSWWIWSGAREMKKVLEFY